ncbi:hypothetical protein [Williamwhitmania taraxaci]|uniref:Uncharacterized protein n=1 Tax=Williamwhitmania taraxaci TaxID=1640674 RepID=A0A1G6KDZ5_9BACT|nr:hypothetical protein [Williamwhitmania taraxaci]SDC29078.1 hypothetical protein SAMN05216323_102441 [Williamwhitmania taraxaci]
MVALKLIGIASLLMAFVVIGLGFNIFFLKKKFPETEVGHNKDMRKRGIKCARTEEMLLLKKLGKRPANENCESCHGECPIFADEPKL